MKPEHGQGRNGGLALEAKKEGFLFCQAQTSGKQLWAIFQGRGPTYTCAPGWIMCIRAKNGPFDEEIHTARGQNSWNLVTGRRA